MSMTGVPGPLRRPIHVDPWTVEIPYSGEPMLVGFGVRELLDLRHVLDTAGWTFEHALGVLKTHGEAYARGEAWRRHFGILAELAE